MPRRSARARVHLFRSLLATVGVALFAALVYLTTLPLGQRSEEGPGSSPATPDEWQATFHERLDGVTQRLEHGRLTLPPPLLQARGAGGLRWMHRGYDVVLSRAAHDDVRAALHLASGGDPSATVAIDEDSDGMRADFGIDGLLTHTVTVHWQVVPPAGPPRVAVVIDDMGNDLLSARQLMSLDFPVALSVMPGRPFSREVAELASLFGREVLLHLPMEAQSGEEHGETGLLRADAGHDEIVKLVDQSLDGVPHVIGVNNHMGSRFTEDPQRMTWVLDRLKGRGLFFLDSLTTAHSVARDVAANLGLPYMSRQVFLDDPSEPAVIQQRLNDLLEAARQHGTAIGIGHPHPETLAALKTFGADATARGATIVALSSLLPKPEEPATTAARAGRK